MTFTIPPAGRLESALGAMLERLASEPEVARVLLVESRAATTACRKAHQDWLDRFTELFEAAMPTPEKGAAKLPAALPQLLYVALAPFIGPGPASERARSE